MVEASSKEPLDPKSGITFRPLLELGFQEIAELFNRCFEDYIVPVNVSAEYKADRCRRDATDMRRSFVTMRDGEAVAIAHIAPWSESVRLAGMGVVKPARGQGVGRITLVEFLRRVRADGFTRATLEVFEQNLPAVGLYESVGFRVLQRLYGFKLDAGTVTGAAELREANGADYIKVLNGLDALLPSVHHPEQVALISLPSRCWTVDGEAFAYFVPPGPERPIIISTFAVRQESQGQGKGRELFNAIRATYPGSPIFLPQIFPEAVSGFMERIGFERLPLNQFEMGIEL